MTLLTAKEHGRLARVALGKEEADLVLKGGRVINCFSRAIEEADVAVSSGRIAAIGKGLKGREVIDCKGLFISPGFIDAHIHIESTMLSPGEFAKGVVPRGTTCVIADPHEIANCFGIDGVRYMIEASKGLPMSIFYTAPSCVPATHLETSGAELGPEQVRMLLELPEIVGLGEMMNFPGVIFGDPQVEAKLEYARRLGTVIDGHAPGLSGAPLSAYVSAAIDSDHECTTKDEAMEKLALGMYLYLRQGTSEQNLKELIPAVTPENLHRCCLVSDDRDPVDIIHKGHMDYSLREAVKDGLHPLDALAMVTINPARRFRLSCTGAVAPGYYADLVILQDLEGFNVESVFFKGRLVAKDGSLVTEIGSAAQNQAVRKSVVIKDDLDFSIEARPGKARVIGIVPGQIVTESESIEPKIVDGMAVADPDRDICKLAVIERHHGTGNIGLGFVKGLGLRQGALASTVAHDSHNIVVAGADDKSMLKAVRALKESGGGLCVANGDRVEALLPLPIAGLMSDRPVREVASKLEEIKAAARALGASQDNPFMILSFLALPVIPKLKLTDKGLVDVEKFSIVPLFFP